MGAHGLAVLMKHREMEMTHKLMPSWSLRFDASNTADGGFQREGWAAAGAGIAIAPGIALSKAGIPPQRPINQLAISSMNCVQEAVGGDRIKQCYGKGHEGFWWGETRQVSGVIHCGSPLCSIEPEATCAASESSLALAPEVWETVVAPRPPSPLLTSDDACTDASRVQIAGPALGFLWFKPLLWASDGWYTFSNLSAWGSRGRSGRLQSKYPLATAEGGLVGIFGFESLQDYAPRPRQAGFYSSDQKSM